MEFITKEIKISAKEVFKILFLEYGSVWIGISIFGFIIFIFAGFVFDLRFFFLALIWIFILFPLFTAFLYFYYGLAPLTAFNTLPHKISFRSDDLKLLFIEYNEETEEEIIKKEYSVDRKSFEQIKTGGLNYILKFGEKGILCVPMTCFITEADFKNFTEYFNYER